MSQNLNPRTTAEALPNTEPVGKVPKDIQTCYPGNLGSPTELYKTNSGKTVYFFGIADFLGEDGKLSEDSGNGFLLFKSVSQYEKCEEYLKGGIEIELAKHVPFPIAVDLKKQYWEATLTRMDEKTLKEFLNTPNDPIHPFVFLPEDVEALALLGYEPGPKATVADTLEDALKQSEEFKILNRQNE